MVLNELSDSLNNKGYYLSKKGEVELSQVLFLDNSSMLETHNPEDGHKTESKQWDVGQGNCSPKFQFLCSFCCHLFLQLIIELLLSFQFFFFIDRDKIPTGNVSFKYVCACMMYIYDTFYENKFIHVE